MKIYLLEDGDWKLFEFNDIKEAKNEFKKRNIICSNSAEIGDYAEIEKFDIFSELSILVNVGVVMNNGVATFYKAVRPDFYDFYSGEYRYKEGMEEGDDGLKKDQSIDCGKGWYWTSFWRAIEFGKDKGKYKIISAEVKMEDVLSVYNKVRVRAFSNVKIVDIKGLITNRKED